MSRRYPILLIAAASLALGASASAAETPPIIARAEACLRANADRVVALEPDLQSAASFLVEFVCAEPAADAARYERNLGWLASFKAMSNGLPKDFEQKGFSMQIEAAVDPETGEFVIPPPKAGERPSPLATMLPQMSTNAAAMFPGSPPTGLRKLAGELVLAAREQQIATGRAPR